MRVRGFTACVRQTIRNPKQVIKKQRREMGKKLGVGVGWGGWGGGGAGGGN